MTIHPIRVLGIAGSPRRGGNTDVLVDEVLRGAAEAGAIVDKVWLNALDIGPCQGCDTCQDGGTCIQQDDMPALLPHMQQSAVRDHPAVLAAARRAGRDAVSISLPDRPS